MHFVKRILSGGQTGVDMAALDFGLKYQIPIGGWCPKGRINESGIIPGFYPLWESSSKLSSVRTEKIVLAADATLIISSQKYIDKGTQLCLDLCQHHNKQVFLFDILNYGEEQIRELKKWGSLVDIDILNIAGNRESTFQGIYSRCLEILGRLRTNKILFQ